VLHDLSKALRQLWRLSSEGGCSYRPDLHYMRGPGPKWHAKYGNLADKPSASAAPVAAALHEVAEHRV